MAASSCCWASRIVRDSICSSRATTDTRSSSRSSALANMDFGPRKLSPEEEKHLTEAAGAAVLAAGEAAAADSKDQAK